MSEISKLKIFILLSITPCLAFGQKSVIQMNDELMANQIPEFAYAVVDSTSVLEENIYGYHHIGKEMKANSADIADYFHLGSNTKAITSYIAAYLVNSRLITWDTRFFELFPELKQKSNSAYYQITLADLLSHRAHIQRFTDGSEFAKLPVFKGNNQQRRQAFSQVVLQRKPAFDKGVSYTYSNAGYTLAVQMLEKVSGKSWEELIDEVVGKKLKLHYAFGWPNLKNPNEPWGHWMINGKLQVVPGNTKYTLNLIEPAGDISMPLNDYLKFVQLNLKGLSHGDIILDAKTYQYLLFGRSDYAMGWANEKINGYNIANHAGSAGTFYCYTIIDEKSKKAIIVMANSSTEKAEKFIDAFVDGLETKYSFNR